MCLWLFLCCQPSLLHMNIPNLSLHLDYVASLVMELPKKVIVAITLINLITKCLLHLWSLIIGNIDLSIVSEASPILLQSQNTVIRDTKLRFLFFKHLIHIFIKCESLIRDNLIFST